MIHRAAFRNMGFLQIAVISQTFGEVPHLREGGMLPMDEVWMPPSHG